MKMQTVEPAGRFKLLDAKDGVVPALFDTCTNARKMGQGLTGNCSSKAPKEKTF